MNSRATPFEQIANGLADSGFIVIDNFLSPIQVSALRQLETFTAGVANLKKAAIGNTNEKQIDPGIRGDYIQWIDNQTSQPELREVLDDLHLLIAYLNKALYLSLKDFELHLTIYPIGSFYKRHFDQFRGNSHRKLSIICYLNEDWKEEQGGQLRMYLPGGVRDILPEGGRMVCFRSDQIEHEVLPATRERWSLTGWILDQVAGLQHL